MPDTAETAHITAPRSMAHLLRTTLMAVGILSLLLSVVGAALLFQHAFAEQFDTDLSRTVEAIAVGYEHSADPQPEQLAQYADGLRLTLVAQDGTVLYDSATADPSTLPNHANRPEIQQAMAEGTGASVRRSATLGYDTHYYAVRLTDGSVLRLADETSNMWSSYNRSAARSGGRVHPYHHSGAGAGAGHYQASGAAHHPNGGAPGLHRGQCAV